MLLPVKWLKDYIKTDKTGRELADGLTLSGSHVESIYSLNKGAENVVVGKILTIENHPNADKLVICKIDIGEKVINIVTGAPNVSEGIYVPVALVGAKLPGDVVINKSDFRGVESEGMLCSLKELGYNDNVISKYTKDGIFIFNEEQELGSDVVDILGLNDEVIEFEITPNRPDCLSIIGMAREASATFNIPIEEPKISINHEEDHISNYLESIEIESENCPRYYAKVIKDVKIQESPLWLQTKLMEAGMRPINNIVDITNFVMLEYGEPLHAFDVSTLEGNRIIVRQAKEGETLVTLDNVERKLSESDLVIADTKNPVAIAGVMGGLDSEITDKTTAVLFEGANFNPKSVRLTAKKFGLRSEASNRFEKGIDPNLGSLAVDRACQLVEQIGAGVVVNSSIDIYKDVKKERIVTLRPERANMLLGLNISEEAMLDYLNSLGLKSELKDGLIYATIPTYRLDLNIEADLIEEIGRLYGFHNIESKPLTGVLTRGLKPYNKVLEDKAKAILVGLGYNEVMTYSFISPKAYNKINLPEDSKLREYIRLINPLGEDYSVMRTTLIPTMMELLARNYKRSVESVYAFEIGNTFIPSSNSADNLPSEKKVLSIGFYGKDDFYYLKESIETLLNRLGIFGIEYIREENNPTFHPGRTAKMLLNGSDLGIFGETHMDVCENYEIDERVYIAQLDFEKIVELADFDKKYKTLPKYPSMSRDIALIVDEDVLFGDIKKIVLKHGGDLVDNVEIFDIYRGNQIPEGKKSIAFSILYRSHERTLTDNEVNQIQDLIISDLENNLGGELRS
ncbi:MAG: phenylalanine--tRNA ligase subunit beta [Tissierellaceae bacterium]|nr:phenylalanine--tRNA ligase subunit beta [Tissierellaceae bacterium]